MEFLKEYDQKPIEATKALGGGIPGFTGISFKETNRMKKREKGGMGLNVPAFFAFTKGAFTNYADKRRWIGIQKI